MQEFKSEQRYVTRDNNLGLFILFSTQDFFPFYIVKTIKKEFSKCRYLVNFGYVAKNLGNHQNLPQADVPETLNVE